MNNNIIGNTLRDLNIREHFSPQPNSNASPLLNDVAGVSITGNAAALDWEDNLNQASSSTSMARTLEGLLEERRTNIGAASSSKDNDRHRSGIVSLMRQLMAANCEFMKTDGTLVDESVALSAAFGTGIEYTEDMSAAKARINELLDLATEGETTDAFAKYKSACSTMFKLYHTVGNGLRDAEAKLKERISSFDGLQARLKVLTSLEKQDSAEYAGLVAATESYLKAHYADFKVDDEFRQYIALYKQWSLLRSIVTTFRVADGTAAANVPTCGICMEDPVSSALQTCGHTYCSSCVRQLGSRCAVCRSAITGKIKIFFT